MVRSERICRLINEFMKYHSDGYSITEIAEIFQVDFGTVYKHLQEIADKNGVTRESLLQVVHSPHGVGKKLLNNKSREDPYKLNESFDILLNEITNIKKNIDLILSQEDL